MYIPVSLCEYIQDALSYYICWAIYYIIDRCIHNTGNSYACRTLKSCRKLLKKTWSLIEHYFSFFICFMAPWNYIVPFNLVKDKQVEHFFANYSFYLLLFLDFLICRFFKVVHHLSIFWKLCNFGNVSHPCK